ncbi:hypothetical protein LSAT2_002860, partial [Lamellibrachia satsuma]
MSLKSRVSVEMGNASKDKMGLHVVMQELLKEMTMTADVSVETQFNEKRHMTAQCCHLVDKLTNTWLPMAHMVQEGENTAICQLPVDIVIAA